MRESPRSDGRGLRGKWKRTRITREGDQGRRRNLPPTGQGWTEDQRGGRLPCGQHLQTW